MIYEIVKKIAEQKGIAISALEKNAGLGNGVIGGWKTSSPRLDTLEKVAAVLEMDVTDLITMARGEGEDEAVAAEDNPNER